MSKLNILSVLLFGIMIMLSCEDKIPERETSPLPNPNSNKVYFPQQKHKVFVTKDASSFEVKIAREIAISDLTVDLHLISANQSDLFSIPKSVNFAADETEKTFEVKMRNIDFWKSYFFSIEIDVEHTSLYIADSVDVDGKKIPVYPVINLNITKEDFEPYAKGDYFSGVIAKRP